jgi:simple sugar transport system substrate-binding protein
VRLRKSRLIILFLAVLMLSATAVFKIAAQNSGPTDKWCSGVNIVFFPGGSPGGSFETVVYNGALQASADLGANTQYVWSDWQPDKMVTQFQQAVATKPDGIAIMGHPGDEAYKPLVDQAESQGIIVTSQNTQLSELQAAYAGAGFGYSGATLYNQGMSVGNEAVTNFGLKEGDEVMVWGLLSQAGRGQAARA